MNVVNYRKCGERFLNSFLLTPIRRNNGELAYFAGIQRCPPKIVDDRRARLAQRYQNSDANWWIDATDVGFHS